MIFNRDIDTSQIIIMRMKYHLFAVRKPSTKKKTVKNEGTDVPKLDVMTKGNGGPAASSIVSTFIFFPYSYYYFFTVQS